jgi:DNA polymerase epsilon subunit 1
MLSVDSPLLAMDVLLQRRLLQSGHLSWLSEAPTPDLGGLPVNEVGNFEDLSRPEVVSPGMFRTVCIELQLTGLAVNAVLEANHVHQLDGLDIAKDMFAHDSISLADDAMVCASAFRLVRSMLRDLMRDVIESGDESADMLLMNAYRWISSPAALLHDPALQRMLSLLMKKIWMQLLAELRALGAQVMHRRKLLHSQPHSTFLSACRLCRWSMQIFQ